MNYYNEIIEKLPCTKNQSGKIMRCISGKMKSFLGYFWTINDDFTLPVNEKNRRVGRFKNNMLIKEYPSRLEASRQTGVSPRVIWNSCNNLHKRSKEYKWEYLD